MKVLDLQCSNQHVFEGWFGSEDDFQGQLVRGLVSCPMCGNASITKRLSAPRLNFGAVQSGLREESAANSTGKAGEAAVSAQGEAGQAGASGNAQALVANAPLPQEMMAAWMAMAKRMMANTADVGDKFAEEARKIHYGETEERGIRGRATRDETEALLEEGINVMPFILPEALKGPLQ
jgi:hypothetical protein